MFFCFKSSLIERKLLFFVHQNGNCKPCKCNCYLKSSFCFVKQKFRNRKLSLKPIAHTYRIKIQSRILPTVWLDSHLNFASFNHAGIRTSFLPKILRSAYNNNHYIQAAFAKCQRKCGTMFEHCQFEMIT